MAQLVGWRVVFANTVVLSGALALGTIALAADAAGVKPEVTKKAAAAASSDAKSPDKATKPATAPDGGKAKKEVKSEDAAKGEAKAKDDATEPPANFSGDAPPDPLPALGEGDDDFKDIDKRAAQNAKDFEKESEDARIERELREYKEQAAKEEAERSRQEAKAREEARARAREEAAKEAKSNHDAEKEAQKKAAKAPGITEDELNWKGLED